LAFTSTYSAAFVSAEARIKLWIFCAMCRVSETETQVIAFLAIFAAALCGYFGVPAVAWPAAALSLILVSWAEHYALARRGVEAGLGDVVRDTLVRSSGNALVATGVCYWAGVVMRSLSGL
jgi:hypothetical protein